MWTCPKCQRTFKTINQSHSCAVTDTNDHFKNKAPVIREIYDALLKAVEKIGPVQINTVKSAIFLKTKSTFMEIKPKKDHVLIGFYLDHEVNEFPLTSSLHLSKNRVVHTVQLSHPGDITPRLISWLKESYGLIG